MDEQNKSSKGPGKGYIFAIVFLVLLTAIGIVFAFTGNKKTSPILQTSAPSAKITENASPSASPMNNATELQIIDEKVGTGVEATAGKKVSVNYTGTLANGTAFDSNTDPKFGHVSPFTFTLGAGQVIPGWDKGVAGMKVGGKRKLTIPSSLAYGDNGIPGTIPGGATLIFEVELLGVE